MPNRLSEELSPYLLQHQNNPVDWYPWSEEAFEKAREENKPVFLSIGYATCHWCHDQQSNAIITAQNIKGEYQENKGICRLVSGNLNLRHRRQTPCMDDPGFGLLAVFADGTTALLPAIDPPADPMARVQVIHNSPYAEAALVDVYVNGALALDDVAFRDASPFLDLPAETPLTIDVTGADAPDNSSPVFTLAEAVLPTDATLLIVAAGDPLARSGNPEFNLFIANAREAAATAGNVEAIVFHANPT